MAFELQGFKFTAIAGENLTAKQYHFMKLSANLTVVGCSAVTDIPCGVLQNNPVATGSAEVMVYGITKLVAPSLTAGNLVGTSNTGTGVVITPTAVGSIYYAGQCIIGTGAGSAEVASVLINCATPIITSGS